jgi:hypothetical protein
MIQWTAPTVRSGARFEPRRLRRRSSARGRAWELRVISGSLPCPEAPRSGFEGRSSKRRSGDASWSILRDARLRLALRMRSAEFAAWLRLAIRMRSAEFAAWLRLAIRMRSAEFAHFKAWTGTVLIHSCPQRQASRLWRALADLRAFLKNNTPARSPWQENVAFRDQLPNPQPGAFAASQERRAISPIEFASPNIGCVVERDFRLQRLLE